MNVLRRSECNIKENVPSNSPKLVWPLEDPSKDSYLPAELRHSLTGASFCEGLRRNCGHLAVVRVLI